MYPLTLEWLLGQTNRQAAPVAKDPDVSSPINKRLTAAVYPHNRIVSISITSPIFPIEVTVC
jgi:hypothetical protein